ncbi:uncharacterized protein DS421_14g469240 [Arachis hypogaea]|nr:uncharacterized protein DS421_14g469240 [Arachis hypogaea]
MEGTAPARVPPSSPSPSPSPEGGRLYSALPCLHAAEGGHVTVRSEAEEPNTVEAAPSRHRGCASVEPITPPLPSVASDLHCRRRRSVAEDVERSRRSCLSPPKEEPLPPSIVTGEHTVPSCLWSPESRTGEKGAASPVAAASFFYCVEHGKEINSAVVADKCGRVWLLAIFVGVKKKKGKRERNKVWECGIC